MAFPQVLGKDVQEADFVIHRALVERLGDDETVDVVGFEVGHHVRRRHHAQLDVLVRIETVFG